MRDWNVESKANVSEPKVETFDYEFCEVVIRIERLHHSRRINSRVCCQTRGGATPPTSAVELADARLRVTSASLRSTVDQFCAAGPMLPSYCSLIANPVIFSTHTMGKLLAKPKFSPIPRIRFWAEQLTIGKYVTGNVDSCFQTFIS